ncbi:MAG: hypothetical protein [Bacteriophage sp.]|jgi:hypothetical protein|nr:MAG: hypothetical protein [Bacteriophage sp.]
MKKNLMKKAHEMTKEIKEQYPEVDYKFQLSLCLSFLAQEKGGNKMEVKKLNGSEKQIKWAKNIIKEMESIIKEAKEYRLEESEKKWAKKSESFKEKHNLSSIEDYKVYVTNLVEKSEKELFSEEKASWYIQNFCVVTSYNYDKHVRVSEFSDALTELAEQNKKYNQISNTVNKYSSYVSRNHALDL